MENQKPGIHERLLILFTAIVLVFFFLKIVILD